MNEKIKMSKGRANTVVASGISGLLAVIVFVINLFICNSSVFGLSLIIGILSWVVFLVAVGTPR
ncbi:hypothetical protein ETF27_08310 [Prevotella brunnea]|uniref:Uncharacterized protein n=1 Tax=Prevotella brunnea TaxID=2508867 RepID=A0A5C8GGW2_9BACT|nr:hypothetical protein [Prevotella brunnea]MDR0186281.1 hypothetical protein [Prevotella brunnea]TXJ60458.1 hypothetical protein ETF27_08310 [Prevotella brunnea]